MKLDDAIDRADRVVRLLAELPSSDPIMLGIIQATAFSVLEDLRGEKARLFRHHMEYLKRTGNRGREPRKIGRPKKCVVYVMEPE